MVFDSLTLPCRPWREEGEPMQISTARMAAMAAQLVPCSSSVPPSTHRGTGKGKLFWELGKGPALTLLSMEGFHLEQQQAQPSLGGSGAWGNKQRAQTQSCVQTQAPHSSPSFTDPSPGTHRVPAQGGEAAALQGSLLSLSLCTNPSPQYPGSGQVLQGQFLLPSLWSSP